MRNLRLTDEKAMFSNREFAVLLVDTPYRGGQAVIDRLTGLFEQNNLVVEMELNVHDPSTFDDNPVFDHNPSAPDANSSDDSGAGGSGDWSESRTTRKQELAAVGANGEPVEWAAKTDWRTSAVASSERRLQAITGAEPSADSPTTGVVSSEDPFVRPTTSLSAVLKRTLDIVASLIGLILIGPALLLAMAIIRWTSPGPAIFCQTREGLRGKPFTIYKLRTMVANAEASQQALRDQSHRDGPAFKLKSDPRVTKFGRFLRATCIDELPQLVNVLRGDMSLVGPRPLPWHESRACSHWHRRRLDVRPGLTCFWQIDKANVESFDDWMRLDLQYVDRGNLWIDLVLIYRTFAVALLGRGSH
jgi:lipopolysaccharide/colanic/teichoic acid biosynthesis glycosyltransferase